MCSHFASDSDLSGVSNLGFLSLGSRNAILRQRCAENPHCHQWLIVLMVNRPISPRNPKPSSMGGPSSLTAAALIGLWVTSIITGTSRSLENVTIRVVTQCPKRPRRRSLTMSAETSVRCTCTKCRRNSKMTTWALFRQGYTHKVLVEMAIQRNHECR